MNDDRRDEELRILVMEATLRDFQKRIFLLEEFIRNSVRYDHAEGIIISATDAEKIGLDIEF